MHLAVVEHYETLARAKDNSASFFGIIRNHLLKAGETKREAELQRKQDRIYAWSRMAWKMLRKQYFLDSMLSEMGRTEMHKTPPPSPVAHKQTGNEQGTERKLAMTPMAAQIRPPVQTAPAALAQVEQTKASHDGANELRKSSYSVGTRKPDTASSLPTPVSLQTASSQPQRDDGDMEPECDGLYIS